MLVAKASAPKGAPGRARAPRGAVRRPVPPRGLPPGIVHLDAEPAGEPERVAVFAVGDDVYTMLAEPPVSLALRALDIGIQRGQSYGDVFVMREMLGEDGYRALLDCPTLTRAAYTAITAKVIAALFGALEDEEDPNR